MNGARADGPDRPALGRYDRVRALFLAAARLPQSERDAFIEREAGGDAAFAAEVRALLSHDDPDEGFIAKPALAAAESLASTPRRIGSYVVRAKIGEGGMGAVFEAVQQNTGRVVAVKVLHPSIATGSTRQRFEREARLLARLAHPGIAQVFEAGEAETDFGRQPYFVMERVDGLPITEYASRNGLDTAESLQLFARVCDAVQHAHDRGVVHRDLKPANVLVDASGQPKVLDFGVARLVERDDQRFTSALTGDDLILGTVPYLSPEQASGRAREIDGRADVYSLGVILYELLTGDLPFDVRARPAAEALRIVLDRDPTPPGSRFKALRGDVETIIGKAMEKDRTRRYATPAALASDVRRHLRSEPIAARPPSALYRVRKFARRNRALVAGGLATFAALAAGGVVAAKLALDERAARGLSDWNAYRSGVLLAASELAAGDVAAARAALEGTPQRHRAFEWNHLRRALDGSLATFDAADEPCVVQALAFSEDGCRLYIGTSAAGVRVLALGGDARIASPAGSSGEGASIPALGPRAEMHLAQGDGQRTMSLRRTGSEGEILSAFGARGAALAGAAVSPLGSRVAGWMGDGLTVELFDTSRPEWRPVGRWTASYNSRSQASFSSDGSLLAFGGSEGTIRVVDAESGADRAVFQQADRACGVSFSPDGARLAVGYGPDWVSPDGGVAVYDIEAGTLAHRFSFDAGPVHALSFAPDGAHLAIGTSLGAIHVVDAASGERTATHRSLGSFVCALAYSPDATLLAAGTRSGTVSLFSAALEADEASLLRGHASYVYACAFGPDGKTIASGSWDDTIRLWDAASATELAVLRGHSSYVKRVEVDPSGAHVLSISGDRTYRLWDARTGREIARYSANGDIHDATFASGGSLLVVATGETGRLLYTQNARGGEIVSILREPSPPIVWVAVAPGEGHVAAGAADGSVRIHDLPSLAFVRGTPPAESSIASIAWSSDGERIAVARYGGTIEVLDASTLGTEWVAPLSGGEAFVARFSPGGDRVAAAGRDGRLRLFDSRTGEIVANLRGHGDYIHDLGWSPDGGAIVTASGDKTLRIWDTAPARERLAARIESDSALSSGERAAALREALRQQPK